MSNGACLPLMLPLNLLLILLKLLLLLLLLFFLVMRTWKKFDLSSSSFLRNTFASLIGLNLRIWCFSNGWLFYKRTKNLQNNCWCFQLKIMLLPNNLRGFFEVSNLLSHYLNRVTQKEVFSHPYSWVQFVPPCWRSQRGSIKNY